jgi:hypothetical protein
MAFLAKPIESEEDVKQLSDKPAAVIRSLENRHYALVCALIVVSALLVLMVLKLRGLQVPSPDLLAAFLLAVFFGAIIALVLTLIHDTFVNKIGRIFNEWDRVRFAEEFAKGFFAIHPSLVAPALASIVIADHDCSNKDLAERVRATYFYPIEHKPRFRNYRSVSRLTAFDATTGCYKWSCTRSMKTIRRVAEYRIALCRKSDIESKIVEAGAADAVFTLSEFSSEIAQDRFRELHRQFVVLSSDGELSEVDVHMEIDPKKMKSFQGQEALTDNDFSFCRFYWDSEGPGNEIEMTFETKLSLFKDPFFYDTLQEFAFVEVIEIDYTAIKDDVGDVSQIICVRGPGLEPKNINGRFTARLSALAGPGDGVVLIFRQKKAGQTPTGTPANQPSHQATPAAAAG